MISSGYHRKIRQDIVGKTGRVWSCRFLRSYGVNRPRPGEYCLASVRCNQNACEEAIPLFDAVISINSTLCGMEEDLNG